MRSRLRYPLRVVLPLGGALLSGALGVAAYATHQMNGPTRHRLRDHYTFSPYELDVDHEPVAFRAEGNVTLRGWWLPRPGSDRVVIGCTGHRGAKHELLGIGAGLWREGNNVLLFDFRGRGESDHAACSLAYHELADLQAAIEYARRRVPEARLGVVGYSMGAAVAILVAAQEPSIAAVVADSPFSSIKAVVGHAFARRRLPARPMLRLAESVNRWRYGYEWGAVQPLEAVAAIAPRPLLLIHGSEDRLIPLAHSEAIFANAGEPKDLWVIPGVGHCGGYFADRPEYVARVARFFDAHLKPCGVE